MRCSCFVPYVGVVVGVGLVVMRPLLVGVAGFKPSLDTVYQAIDRDFDKSYNAAQVCKRKN